MCHPEVPSGATVPDVKTLEVSIPVTGGSMPGLLALPEHTPAPAVLIMPDIFGRGAFYDNLARRLAQAGFVALDPEQFFREGPLAENTLPAARSRRADKHFDDARAMEDYRAALQWLSARPEVAGNAVGAIGFCMGGTSIFQAAALYPEDMKAGVAYYGFPAASTPGLPSPIELVDRIAAPIVGLWGDQDEGCGMGNVETMRQKLDAAGKDFTFKVYPGLGHGFLKSFLDEEDSAEGYTDACDSWTLTLDFLRKHLQA